MVIDDLKRIFFFFENHTVERIIALEKITCRPFIFKTNSPPIFFFKNVCLLGYSSQRSHSIVYFHHSLYFVDPRFIPRQSRSYFHVEKEIEVAAFDNLFHHFFSPRLSKRITIAQKVESNHSDANQLQVTSSSSSSNPIVFLLQ